LYMSGLNIHDAVGGRGTNRRTYLQENGICNIFISRKDGYALMPKTFRLRNVGISLFTVTRLVRANTDTHTHSLSRR